MSLLSVLESAVLRQLGVAQLHQVLGNQVRILKRGVQPEKCWRCLIGAAARHAHFNRLLICDRNLLFAITLRAQLQNLLRLLLLERIDVKDHVRLKFLVEIQLVAYSVLESPYVYLVFF